MDLKLPKYNHSPSKRSAPKYYTDRIVQKISPTKSHGRLPSMEASGALQSTYHSDMSMTGGSSTFVHTRVGQTAPHMVLHRVRNHLPTGLDLRNPVYASHLPSVLEGPGAAANNTADYFPSLDAHEMDVWLQRQLEEYSKKAEGKEINDLDFLTGTHAIYGKLFEEICRQVRTHSGKRADILEKCWAGRNASSDVIIKHFETLLHREKTEFSTYKKNVDASNAAIVALSESRAKTIEELEATMQQERERHTAEVAGKDAEIAELESNIRALRMVIDRRTEELEARGERIRQVEYMWAERMEEQREIIVGFREDVFGLQVLADNADSAALEAGQLAAFAALGVEQPQKLESRVFVDKHKLPDEVISVAEDANHSLTIDRSLSRLDSTVTNLDEATQGDEDSAQATSMNTESMELAERRFTVVGSHESELRDQLERLKTALQFALLSSQKCLDITREAELSQKITLLRMQLSKAQITAEYWRGEKDKADRIILEGKAELDLLAHESAQLRTLLNNSTSAVQVLQNTKRKHLSELEELRTTLAESEQKFKMQLKSLKIQATFQGALVNKSRLAENYSFQKEVAVQTTAPDTPLDWSSGVLDNDANDIQRSNAKLVSKNDARKERSNDTTKKKQMAARKGQLFVDSNGMPLSKHQVFAEPVLLKMITQILDAKSQADHVDDTMHNARQNLPEFVMDYMLNKYGLMSVTMKNMKMLRLSVESYCGSKARVGRFGRLLGWHTGMSRLPKEAAHLFLDVMREMCPLTGHKAFNDYKEEFVTWYNLQELLVVIRKVTLKYGLALPMEAIEMRAQALLNSYDSNGFVCADAEAVVDIVYSEWLHKLFVDGGPYEKAFYVADNNHDGVLNLDEFRALVVKLAPKNTPDRVISDLFRKCLDESDLGPDLADVMTPQAFATVMKASGIMDESLSKIVSEEDRAKLGRFVPPNVDLSATQDHSSGGSAPTGPTTAPTRTLKKKQSGAGSATHRGAGGGGGGSSTARSRAGASDSSAAADGSTTARSSLASAGGGGGGGVASTPTAGADAAAAGVVAAPAEAGDGGGISESSAGGGGGSDVAAAVPEGMTADAAAQPSASASADCVEASKGDTHGEATEASTADTSGDSERMASEEAAGGGAVAAAVATTLATAPTDSEKPHTTTAAHSPENGAPPAPHADVARAAEPMPSEGDGAQV